MFRITNMDCIHYTFDTMIIALRLDKVNSLNQNSKKKTCKFVQCNRKVVHRMFKNTIKQFLYVTLHEKANAINILGKYVYCAGGSIARNSGAVNKRLTIQGECVKAIPHNSKCRCRAAAAGAVLRIVRCCLIILPYSMAGTWVSTCGAPPASSSAVTGAGSALVVRRSLATASISLMRFSWLTRVALGS